MGIIKNIKLPNSNEYPVAVFRGTCSTAAGTAAKSVTCSYFESGDLAKGTIIYVTFSYTNSAAVNNLTLSINSTTAKSIKKLHNGTLTNLDNAAELYANETYLFQYDGTYWVCMDTDAGTLDSSLSASEIDTIWNGVFNS